MRRFPTSEKPCWVLQLYGTIQGLTSRLSWNFQRFQSRWEVRKRIKLSPISPNIMSLEETACMKCEKVIELVLAKGGVNFSSGDKVFERGEKAEWRSLWCAGGTNLFSRQQLTVSATDKKEHCVNVGQVWRRGCGLLFYSRERHLHLPADTPLFPLSLSLPLTLNLICLNHGWQMRRFIEYRAWSHNSLHRRVCPLDIVLDFPHLHLGEHPPSSWPCVSLSERVDDYMAGVVPTMHRGKLADWVKKRKVLNIWREVMAQLLINWI